MYRSVLFFRREEICHVVNVVCISLHVCERKMKSEMAFLNFWFLFMILNIFYPFSMYIELYVVKWLKSLYKSAHVKKNRRKYYKNSLGILKEKLRL